VTVPAGSMLCFGCLVEGEVWFDGETRSRLGRPGRHHRGLTLAAPLLGGTKVVFAYLWLNQATVRHSGQLMASGQVTPLTGRRYPLDQIVEATSMPRPGRS
jgi:hypothetical protein